MWYLNQTGAYGPMATAACDPRFVPYGGMQGGMPCGMPCGMQGGMPCGMQGMMPGGMSGDMLSGRKSYHV